MLIRKILFISLIFFSFINSTELKRKITHLGIKDGLSMSAVTGVVQDKKGFIWISTQEGLNRFDGYNFKVYKKEIDDENTLLNNYIPEMALDSVGNLWLSSAGEGITIFNIESNKFSFFSHQFIDSTSLSSNSIFRIFVDSKGNVWLGSNDTGLNRYDPVSNKFLRYNSDVNKKISGNIVSSIYEDNDGKLWVSTIDGGLDLYNPEMDRFEKFKLPGELKGIAAGIYKEHNMFYLATFFDGIYLVNIETQNVEKIFLDKSKTIKNQQPEINFIKSDSKGNLWIATYTNGIFKFSLESKSIIQLSRESENRISNNYITDIIEDNNGLIWIGTYGDGVNIIKPSEKIITNYLNDPDEINTLSGPSVFGVIQDQQDVLWAGTQGDGLNKINRRTGRIHHIKHNPNNKNSLSNDEVFCVTEDRDGYLWIGTLFGLNRLNKETGEFKRFYHSSRNYDTEKSSLSHNTITSLAVDNQNNLWIATEYAGINKLDPSREIFKSYYHILGDDESLSSNNVISIYADQEGYIWCGTWVYGLNRLDPSTGKVKRFMYDKNNPKSIQTNAVFFITEDSKGMMWLGTPDGLIRFDREKEEFKSYREEQGLPNNSVYSVLEDEQGFLWVSTNMGIAKFNPEDETVKIYDDEDGLQGLEFNSNSAYKTSKGEMIFGGYKGVSAFYPEDIKDFDYETKIVLTDVKLGNEQLKIGLQIEGKEIIKKDISYVEEITLPYFENTISLEYSSLDYIAPDKVRYSYKLANLDEDWINAEKRRFVIYNKIPPGEYIFKIKSTNSNGVWDKEKDILKINIEPPIWDTIQFKILAVLLIIMIIYVLYKWKINIVKEQQKKLERIVEERTKELVQINNTKDKFFSIIAHDLKNPFVSLLGFTEILHEEHGDLTENETREIVGTLRKSVKNLYGLLNNLLNWSTLQTGQMQINETELDIVELISHNIDLYRANSERKNIVIRKDIEENLIALSDENIVNTLLRNLISNAIKFTPNDGAVIIKGRKKDSEIDLSVEDTGIGLTDIEIINILNPKVYLSMPGTNNEQGTGIGLALCKELLEKSGGKLSVTSSKGKGSIFKFSIKAK